MIDLEDIQRNWAIITGFAAGLVAWGETRRTASGAKESSKKAHERLDATVAQLAAVKETVARLETHAEYTRSGIDEIKDSLRDIQKRP
jgi:hypothetical protein